MRAHEGVGVPGLEIQVAQVPSSRRAQDSAAIRADAHTAYWSLLLWGETQESATPPGKGAGAATKPDSHSVMSIPPSEDWTLAGLSLVINSSLPFPEVPGLCCYGDCFKNCEELLVFSPNFPCTDEMYKGTEIKTECLCSPRRSCLSSISYKNEHQ